MSRKWLLVGSLASVALAILGSNFAGARPLERDEPELVREELASDELRQAVCEEIWSLLDLDEHVGEGGSSWTPPRGLCKEASYTVTAKWRDALGFVYRLQIEVDWLGTELGDYAELKKCTATARWQSGFGDRRANWSVSADECE